MSDMSGASVCPSCGWDDRTSIDNPLYLPSGRVKVALDNVKIAARLGNKRAQNFLRENRIPW
jgi:hypothetical protein